MTSLPETPRPAPADGAPAAPAVWTCPFCSLLCDDLTLRVAPDGTLEPAGADCQRRDRAIAWFKPEDRDCAPTVDGQVVSLDTALERAAQILRTARQPLFGGMTTDVAGARALYPLANASGAVIDHLHGDATTQSTLAMQDRGTFFTTFAEIRTRADVLVCFGTQPSSHYPRFYERASIGTAQQPPDAPTPRLVAFVGTPVDPALAGAAHVDTAAYLPDADPYDAAALLSALCAGRPPAALSGNVAAAEALLPLVERLRAARYAVFVWETGALPGPHTALLVEALHRMVKTLNAKTRAATFALGGSDGATTVNYTVTWLSGLPLRTRIGGRRAPGDAAPVPAASLLDYDPHRYATARLLGAREADALLWVSSFGPEALPATLADDVPAIVLCHPALARALPRRAGTTVVIPVATPGIDSPSHLFRVDSSVVVPLAPVRAALHPSVAEIARRCLQALQRGAPQAGGHAAKDTQ